MYKFLSRIAINSLAIKMLRRDAARCDWLTPPAKADNATTGLAAIATTGKVLLGLRRPSKDFAAVAAARRINQ